MEEEAKDPPPPYRTRDTQASPLPLVTAFEPSSCSCGSNISSVPAPEVATAAATPVEQAPQESSLLNARDAGPSTPLRKTRSPASISVGSGSKREASLTKLPNETKRKSHRRSTVALTTCNQSTRSPRSLAFVPSRRKRNSSYPKRSGVGSSGGNSTPQVPVEYPCSVCGGNVNWRGWSVQCAKCSLWVHAACSCLEVTTIRQLRRGHDWACPPCEQSQ